MHSSDFDRMMNAFGDAGLVSREDAVRVSNSYYEARERIEREAEAGYKPKPFERLLLIDDPLLGVPLFIWAIIAWVVVRGIT